MDAIGFWITQETRRVESDCLSRLQRVANATTLADVVRETDVHLKPELRALRHTIPGLKRLETQASDRLRAMIASRLERIAQSTTPEQALHRRGKLLQDCQALRGKFPREYHYADRESQRLHYLVLQAAKPPQENPES